MSESVRMIIVELRQRREHGLEWFSCRADKQDDGRLRANPTGAHWMFFGSKSQARLYLQYNGFEPVFQEVEL